MARNCANGLQNPDSSRSEVRRGANAVNLALTGAGELSSEELVEDFGSFEVARQWVAAVYDATEVWVAALAAPGDTDCTDSTDWDWQMSTVALPEWNRLYVSKSGVLRPCLYLCLTVDGRARLQFRCDRAEGNWHGQLKPSDRLRHYRAELVDLQLSDLTDAQLTSLHSNTQTDALTDLQLSCLTDEQLNSLCENVQRHTLAGPTDGTTRLLAADEAQSQVCCLPRKQGKTGVLSDVDSHASVLTHNLEIPRPQTPVANMERERPGNSSTHTGDILPVWTSTQPTLGFVEGAETSQNSSVSGGKASAEPHQVVGLVERQHYQVQSAGKVYPNISQQNSAVHTSACAETNRPSLLEQNPTDTASERQKPALTVPACFVVPENDSRLFADRTGSYVVDKGVVGLWSRIDTTAKRFVTLMASPSTPEWESVTRRVTTDLATNEVIEDIDSSHPQWDENSFLYRALPTSVIENMSPGHGGISTDFTHRHTPVTVPKTNSEELTECMAISITPTDRMKQLGVTASDRFRAQQGSTEWKPSCKSILYLLHKSDLAGRWQEIVKARLRKHKKRSARNLRYNLKLREKKSTMKLVQQLKQAGLKYAQCRPALLQRYSCKKNEKGEPLCHGTDCSCQTLKGKATIAGVQKPTVCGIEVQRELLQPGRKAFTPAIVAQSSIPVVFYYVAYAGLLHALFFCAEYIPAVSAIVEWQGSALVSLLSVIVMIAGTRLYNGSMIAAALMVAWQCIGLASPTVGGPIYWLDLLLPSAVRQAMFAVVVTVLSLAALQKTAKQSLKVTTRAARASAKYIAATRQRRAAATELTEQNEKIRETFSSTYVEVELVDNPGVLIRVLLDSGAALSVFSKRALRHVWYKVKHKLKKSLVGDSMVAAGGDSLGTNLGITNVKFKFPGLNEIHDWPVEVIDNDGVPSILGVDFLKHLNATLTYSNAGDACSWVNTEGKRVTIPMHCTAPEIAGEFSLTMAGGAQLQPYGERGAVRLAMAYVDVPTEQVRFNQTFWCSPEIVTVESNNSMSGEDDRDLMPTTCISTASLTPQLKMIDGKLRVVVYIPLSNKTDSDMVLTPGIRIGSVSILSPKDHTIASISKEDYCAEKIVKAELPEYTAGSHTKAAREGVKKFEPKTELPKGDWRRSLKYKVPDMLEQVWLHEDKSEYNKFIERYKKDLHFGDILTAKQTDDMKLLLFIFRKAASENPKVATPIDGLECRLQFSSANPKPYSRGLPRLSPGDMAIQSEMTRTMLHNGVIEYADSEWSTGVVMAKKKGTTDKRYAVDYRGLNQELIGNVIGVPRIDDLLDTWSKSKWWSTFDLAAAFWSIPMREQDKKFTAFHAYCDGGFQQYQFRVMPFGLKPASSLFQAAFQRVMANLPFCRVYIDDGVCATDTDSFEDHIQHLAHCFVRLEANNMTLKMSKSLWATKELPIVGHVIKSGQGCVPDPSKVECMLDMAPPCTILLLKSLLGAAGYLSKYIPDYAALVLPLREMDDDRPKYTDISEEWSERRLRALESLKAALTSAPVLRAPDFSKPWIILTDCSDHTMHGCMPCSVR